MPVPGLIRIVPVPDSARMNPDKPGTHTGTGTNLEPNAGCLEEYPAPTSPFTP